MAERPLPARDDLPTSASASLAEQSNRADSAGPPPSASATQSLSVPDDHPAATGSLHVEAVTDVRGLLSHIRTLIKNHTIYPRLAKHRGWEGEVLVGFRINSAGVIEDVRIAQGSGYPVLDTAAVVALRRMGSVPDAVRWLPSGAADLELALVYRLTDG